MQKRTIDAILDSQRKFFAKGVSRETCFRIQSLKKLHTAIKKHEVRIIEALAKDLGKSPFESYATEIGIVLEEINYHIKNIREWMKPVRVPSPLTVMPARGFIMPEPVGVVLIMAPWNYPFQLLIAPLVGAISSGCCAVIKPSDISSHTAKAIDELISETFDDQHIAVVTGNRDVIREVLSKKFDYIFFTGGTNLGKIVAEAAAKELTPVTLELGGKSPCIVDKHANLAIAARRLAWGKFLNAGQTCIAPDYLLVHKDVAAKLLILLKKQIAVFFGEHPDKSPDFGRIISPNHFDRVISYLENGTVYCGGFHAKESRYIEPTILTGVNPSSPVMQEEIFGPVLPVIEFEKIDDAIDFITARPKPLALYLFSNKRKIQKKVMKQTSFGGGCINDVVMHIANQHLPFGGIGNSGMGSYHGKRSFDTFTHYKGILKNRTWPDIPVRYAPYSRLKMFLLKIILG